MKKIILILFSILTIFLGINKIKANEYSDLPYEARLTFENFIYYLNNGDKQIYNILDSNNQNLNNNVDKYLHSIKIIYEIENTTIIDKNHYKIEAKISASGVGWNISGLASYFEVKLIDNNYKVVNTNLFDIVGIENVMKKILKVFAAICGIFLSLGIVITIIVVIIIKKNKKLDRR